MIRQLPAAVNEHLAAVDQLATNWWGLISLIVIFVLGPSVGVLVTVWQNSKTRNRVGGIENRVGGVEAQVTNGGSNLADTVGRIASMVSEQGRDIRGLREDIGGLRGELRDERQARIEDVARIERDRRQGG